MSFSGIEDLYQNVVMDRGRNPRYMRAMEPYDASAQGDNPMCGDRVEVRIAYDPEGRVAEAAFQARGCAISIASADLMAELVRGRTPDDIRALSTALSEIVQTGETSSSDLSADLLRPLSGVAEYPSRRKCATLPWAALNAALNGGKEASSE